jgi:hypothetical protein
MTVTTVLIARWCTVVVWGEQEDVTLKPNNGGWPARWMIPREERLEAVVRSSYLRGKRSLENGDSEVMAAVVDW